ncbi:MAG: FtsW/RodA/SpoVE family cell cycle protein [Clostridia bacterium]|nr:FtsW/RodA/SpoVE family cell cycle protein [Clostridia bacterium]
MKTKNKLLSGLFVSNGMDVPFFIIMLGLMAFGLVMLLSSSYAYSYYETDGESSLHFFFREIFFMAFGLSVMYFFSRLDYKKLKYFANIALLISWGLVLLTIVIGKIEGGEINRWLSLGFFDIQPSEIAKFAVVLFCANGLDKNRKKMVSTRPSRVSWAVKLADITNGKIVFTEGTVTLFFYAIFVGLTAVFVLLGSHLSGAILILLFGVAMLWMGEGRARWFVIGGIAAVIVLVIVINFYDDIPILKDYMADRIGSWLNKDLTDTDKRWQTNHSLFALGSGGFFGSGLGNSKQKYFYVSESHTDFIFSIIGEELGFVGCCLVLGLFALLILRGVYIGMRARDRFGALLAFGIMMQIGLQVALNVAVVTDTLPNTGISLPFFSYGGSSTLVTLGEMGFLLSVSRQADLPKLYSFSKSKKQKV